MVLFFFRNARRQNQGFKVPDCTALFSKEAQNMRWFLLPSEAKDLMSPFKKSHPIAEDRLSLLMFRGKSWHDNQPNPIGTLGGSAKYPHNVLNKPECKKALERGYWLKHSKIEKPEDESKSINEDPIDQETIADHINEAEHVPEEFKHPPKASLTSWFRKKKSNTEILTTDKEEHISDTLPSPVSQIIVKSSEIPIQMVNSQEVTQNQEAPNVDMSSGVELEPEKDSYLRKNLESIPEEEPLEVLKCNRNPHPVPDTPDEFFDKFMDKWDEDREQNGHQPEPYVYGLEQHQSGKEVKQGSAEIQVN